MKVKPGYKQTDAGVVPEEWRVKFLDDCVRSDAPICYGILMPGDHFDGGVPVVKVRDILDGAIAESSLLLTHPTIDAAYKRSRLSGGDVLITIRGTTGRVALVSDELTGANITQDTARVRIRTVISNTFIYYALQSEGSQKQIALHTIGQAVKGINIRDVRSLLIALPGDAAEQRAIATALSDVDALLSGLDRLIAKKRDLKQAALQQLLTGQTRLPGFKGEWEVKPFGDLTRPRRDRFDPRQTGAHEFCVELEHLESGTGKLLGCIRADENSSLKSAFREGDVLFGKLRAYLRKYWLAGKSGVCSTEIWVFAPDKRLITSPYLYHLVGVDRFIDAASTAYGTHMPRSDWGIVKSLEIHLPPLPEQTAIAEVLTSMDDELAALEQRREKTRTLKQAMMQELLTGRTRLV